MGGTRRAHCQLLGGFRLFDPSGQEIHFPVIKGAAIIAYLAVFGQDRISRSELTGLLWGDKPDATARTSLRQCLHQVRAKLATVDPAFLSITQREVSLDRSKFGSDVEALLDPALVDQIQPGDMVGPDQFLAGFDDLDPAFSDWLRQSRSYCETRQRAMLQNVLTDQSDTLDRRLGAARRLSALDPTNEAAARLLIEEAAKREDPVEVLRRYQTLWTAMDEEWGEEPSPDLQAFVGQTRARLNDGQRAEPAQADVASFRKYLTVIALKMEKTGAPQQIMARLRNSARDLIVGHGGSLIAPDGDTIRAVIGVQNAEENNAREGIELALKLKDEFSGDDALLIGAGLDTGYLLVSPANAPDQTLQVSGPVIDKATALAHSDRGFSICAAQRTLHGLSGHYHTTPEPGTEGGAFRVLGSNAAATPDELRGKRAAFVGRAPFLAALWEVWVEAFETNSLQIASIQGDIGVGKTRLADELLHRLSAEGIQTLRAECNPYDRSAPLEPLTGLLSALGRPLERGDLQPEVRDRAEQARKIDAIARRLSAALNDRPAAIFIDDWQWADDATRLALGRFAASAARQPVFLILTSRNVPAEEWLVNNSHQIVVPNLTAREVLEKAELLLNRPIDRRLKQQILAKSSGNPLFLEEVCHALGSPQFGQDHGGIIEELPANVQGLFARRVEQLSPQDVDVVFAAAVHGDQIDPALLSRVIGRPVEDATYDRLDRSDILISGQSGGPVRFKHGLARDIVYNMIPEDRRRALHLQYAKCLSEDAPLDEQLRVAERLTFHYRGGGDLATAARFAEASGDKALMASALDQAFQYYSLALNLLDRLPMDQHNRRKWIAIAGRWAVPTIYAPSYDHLAVLDRAANLAEEIGDEGSSALMQYWLGYSQYMLGHHDKALHHLRLSRDIAQAAGDAKQANETMAIEGCVLASVAQYDQAEEKMREALKIKDQHPGSQTRAPVTSVYTRANLALLLADKGQFEEADAYIAEALHRVQSFEHEVESSILSFSSAIHIWRGAWEDALEHANRSRERSEKVSSSYLMGFSRCVWGYAHWRIHGGTHGLDMLARTARWMQDRSMNMYISIICGWLAEAMAESGRAKEAEAACSEALERARIGEIAGAAMACRASALVAIKERRFDAAEARLAEARAFARARQSAHEDAANALMTARLYRALERGKEADAEVEQAKAIYKRLGLQRRYEMACRFEREHAEI